MGKYILSCTSTVDLSAEYLKSRGIVCAFFHYSVNGKSFIDDLGKTVPFRKLYKAMRDGADVKTSQVNAGEMTAHFEKYLLQGYDILHVSTSAGISGECNSSRIAAEDLAEKYPERKILLADSLGGSSGYGLIMDKLADLRDSGLTLEAVGKWAKEHCSEMQYWFYTGDLAHLIRGGRITKASGWFGTMLQICPIMSTDSTGHIALRYKIRTKDKATEEVVNIMEREADGGLLYSDKCFVSHADSPEDANKLAKLIESRFKHLNGKVMINDIGATMGIHGGPGMTAVFYWGKPVK